MRMSFLPASSLSEVVPVFGIETAASAALRSVMSATPSVFKMILNDKMFFMVLLLVIRTTSWSWTANDYRFLMMMGTVDHNWSCVWRQDKAPTTDILLCTNTPGFGIHGPVFGGRRVESPTPQAQIRDAENTRVRLPKKRPLQPILLVVDYF